MKARWILVGAVTVALAAGLVFVVFRPLPVEPEPAEFHCYDLGQGAYVPLQVPEHAFGIGLSYATHIEETASNFEPDGVPPVFRKSPRGMVRTNSEVALPTPDELIATADAFEPGLGGALRDDFPDLPPLLDYEVEMGFVLLEDTDPSQLDDPRFAPLLGFFIANDLSARSIAILGEGRDDRYAYWGISKSFPGFMPVADKAWVPREALPNWIPCLEIETIVNGEVRQRQSTADMIYTPREMLRFVHAAFPGVPLRRGLVVLTGTPGGVAMTTPRWLVRFSDLVRLSRFRKLSAKLGNPEPFLKAGDRVTVRGEGLGKVTVTIAEP